MCFVREYNECKKKLNDVNSELEKLKEKGYQGQKKDIDKSIQKASKEMKDISNKFETMSFGIEHFLRELGQLFESKNGDYQKLPKLMADMIVMGIPLELMDGNVSSVPVKWLKAVFKELSKQIGEDKKIYVLSILGIQSTGKSTLLNTMFGSKFAVSSGRCTKGVFVQLLPLKQDQGGEPQCDYVLIMDSEGLRSPELSNKESYIHDNEIATFITCLANTTIVNFWGQTFSKDMSDIIQIASHAFIRMAKVDIKSSFHLLFAGVQDITAEERNQLGVNKIMDQINKMIQEAAENEGKAETVHGLQSIFPLCSQLFPNLEFPQFLPVLWTGQMSPPEARYGESVSKLRNSLIQCLGPKVETSRPIVVPRVQHFTTWAQRAGEAMNSDQRQMRTQSLNVIFDRLNDVWQAIKNENFIFAFKNSQAIKIYSDIQHLYDTKITNLRINVFKMASDVGEDVLKMNFDDVASGTTELLKRLNDDVCNQIQKEQEDALEELKTFCENSPNPEMSLKFLPDFESEMVRQVHSWIEDENNRITNNLAARQKTKKNKAGLLAFKKDVSKEAQNGARELRKKMKSSQDEISTGVIDQQFETMFKKQLEKAQFQDKALISQQKGELERQKRKLVSSYSQRLHYHLQTPNPGYHMQNLQEELADFAAGRFNMRSINVDDVRSPSKHIWSSYTIKSKESVIRPAEELKWSIIRECKDMSNNANKNPNSNYTKVLNDILEHALKRCECEIVENWTFKPIFKSNLTAFVYARALKDMEKVKMGEIEQLSLRNFLEKEKDNLRNDFRQDSLSADQDSRISREIVDHIVTEVLKARISKQAGSELFENHLSKLYLFQHKNEMFFYLHKDILESSNVEEVLSFVDNYSSHVKKWIQCNIIKHCMAKDMLDQIFSQLWSQELKQVLSIISSYGNSDTLGLMEEAAPEKVEEWFDSMVSELKKTTPHSEVHCL